MERDAPADKAAFKGRFPEHAYQGPNQQHLEKTHSHMRRHFECSQFEQAELQTQTLGRKKLVNAELGAMRVPGYIDQEIAEQGIHNPRRAIA